MRRDIRHEEKLRKKIELHWLYRQRQALQQLQEIQAGTDPEATLPWNERSVRTAVNVKIAETIGGDIRAKRGSGNTTNVFGVVLMPERIADKDVWEKAAREVGQRAPVRAVIEAVAEQQAEEPADGESE